MALQLHSWPRSSGTRISWALEELDVPYEYVEVDQEKQEHRSPRYLAINPHGKVPALVDGPSDAASVRHSSGPAESFARKLRSTLRATG